MQHPNYFPYRKTVYIEGDEVAELDIALEPRPGKLIIDVKPMRTFQLFANSQVVEPEGGAFILPPMETLDLAIQSKDFLTARRSIYLEPNEVQQWDLELQPIPAPRKHSDWMVPYMGIAAKWVPAGADIMGSELRERERLPDEEPLTKVEFKEGFWVGQYEITQGQYYRIMRANPSEFKGVDLPVENVSWEDAQLFGRRLTAVEREANRLPPGYVYRLPTEAEWEYAARSGTDTAFSFGDEADPAKGNFQGRYPRNFDSADIREEAHYGTKPVGSYAPNGFGLYDMHGNVREWVQNWWAGRYPGGVVNNFMGPEEGTHKVYRGGGWEDFANRSRSAARDRLRPASQSSSLGFRIVLAPELKP